MQSFSSESAGTAQACSGLRQSLCLRAFVRRLSLVLSDVQTDNDRMDFQPLRKMVDRRDLLKAAGVGVAASCLPRGLEAAAVGPGKAKSVLFLWMAGGVTHIDSFDPKPSAPSEIRGTLSDIATNLPGVRFCETLPNLSKIADQLAVLRSYSHGSNDHLDSQVYTLTGRKVNQANLFTHPNIGSIVSHLRGPRAGMPGYMAIPGVTRPGPPPYNFFVGGWLGSTHAPYCLGGLPKEPDFTVKKKSFHPNEHLQEDLVPKSLTLEEFSLGRLNRRARLRERFDSALRHLDKQDNISSAESNYQGALRLLKTPKIRTAFDIKHEKQATRENYGRTKIGGRCLMARRLIEAGARFVMVDYGYDSDYGNIWDNHNAPSQKHPPIQTMVKRAYHVAGMDKAFAALISDMRSRGLLESTMVVFVTEFGRTPKINKRGGRDHWGAAGSLFFTGGGTRVGQVIGKTDKNAAEPVTRGYSPADVTATIYSAMGINYHAMVHDILDRPRPILPKGSPIREVFRG